jgi:hypothetical protein
MDHIEEFIVYSEEEKEEMAKSKQSKKTDNIKPNFTIQCKGDAYSIVQ